MAFRIRPATTADIAAMQDVERDAGRSFAEIGMTSIAEDEPDDDATLQAYIDASRAWVADVDGIVAGYLVASIVDGEGHIDQVSVRYDHQRNGLGRALVETAVSWSARRAFHGVTLTTFRDVAFNAPAYRRLGFHDLAPDELGPELQAVRAAEVARGIDVAPRLAMRRDLAR